MLRVLEGGRNLEVAMKVAVKIRTDSDTNGGPRRGWLVYLLPDNEFVAWVEEGFEGEAALKKAYPEAVVLCCLRVPVAEYMAAREDL